MSPKEEKVMGDILTKLRGLDCPTLLALIDAFPNGRAGVDAVLRGESAISLNEVLRLLVDQTGRCIPSALGVTSRVRDENRSFTVIQPAIDYANIRAWYKDMLPQGSKILEATQFEDTAEAARERILANPQIANLFKRAMPVLFPQYSVGDVGTALQEFFLPAVKKGYEFKFPNREFRNWRDGELVKQVTSLPNLGGEKLLTAMRKGPGMFWFFPHPLQGFSPLAQREASAILTAGYSLGLAGAIVNSLAIAGFPEQLVGSYQTPGYDCSGDFWKSPVRSFNFKADDDDLYFDNTDNLADPCGYYSGSLFFLG